MNRRQLLKVLSLAPAVAMLTKHAQAADHPIMTKPIPSSGEAIPIIGMGTWISFNVGNNTQARNDRTEVLKTFFDLGGGMVDSSPMYGSAEEVMGYALDRLGRPQKSLFSTTKVWTRGDGEAQIRESFDLWGLKKFDLYQVHNLVNWEAHLPYLLDLKKRGLIRYVGITTSHGRRHGELEKLINEQGLDFVQLTYNVFDRDVEQRLLPAAQQNGVAVIANRPFQGGRLFNALEGKPLPAIAAEIGCANWAEYFLKFVVSHPAVTCAIPATSQVAHMKENMGAMRGELPNAKQRVAMLNAIRAL